MKMKKLLLLAILSLMAVVSCKKDEDPNQAAFKINKEAEKIEVGAKEAVISGTYEYPGKDDRINVRVGTGEFFWTN